MLRRLRVLLPLWVLYACAPGTGSAPVFNDNGGNTGQGGSAAGAGGIAATGNTTSTGNVGNGGVGAGGMGSGSTTAGGGGAGGIVATGGSLGTGGVKVFDAGTDPNRNKVAAGQVCERLATVQCAGESYCCNNPGRTYQDCYTAQLAGCNSVYLDQITLNSIAAYNATKAEAAFTTFEQLASTCDIGVAKWAIATTGLRGIIDGTVPPNGNCSSTFLLDKAATAAALASCTNPDTDACLPATTWTCAARGPAGSPCFTDINCVDDVYCDNPSLNLTGATCAARKANGVACAAANECLSLTCKGSVCVAADTQTAYCLK